MEIRPSTLYAVATPIGNLEDITFRAVEVLRSVDAIICEDTRVTARLLARYEISGKELIPHFKQQETRFIPKILAYLSEGKSLALVTDAGTPGISDPGYFLISKVLEAGFLAEPIPGVSALTALLSVSHISSDQFVFLGFLPHKKGRMTLLKQLAQEKYPVILYESTHRIQKLFSEILEHCGDRELCIGRELTKMHETIFRGTVGEAVEYFSSHSIKGEFVLIIDAGKDR